MKRISIVTRCYNKPEFLRYNVSLLGILITGLIALAISVSGMGMHPLLGEALVTFFAVGLSYLVHRHFSFQKK